MGTNTYSYTGNQLSSISGALNSSYVYDANGNQTSDSQKGINISYNYLNLPQTINKASTSESMQNTWLSNGAKIRKTVGSLIRDYAGGIEYNNSSIEFIQTEEGRAIPSGSSYSYEYMIKDHLGNTRALLKQDGSILETNDYYPFGLQISRAGQTVPSPENRYKYNGKELQTELGLMQYDYGARFYDPVIGRWNVIDPLAEKNRSWTPYHYTKNNPISRIDPDGMDDIYYNSKGVKTKTIERSWLFELFVGGDRSYINDDKGKSFKLTNQALGVINSGKFKGFESNWENSDSKTGFSSLLKKATEPKGSENAFFYVKRESQDGGDLDQKQNLDPNKIYGASGKAMNRNEAGNYLWGAALAKFGFSTSDAITLAHGGTLYLETISRPNREGRGWSPGDIIYRLGRARLDEADEVEAIEAGSVKVLGYKLVK